MNTLDGASLIKKRLEQIHGKYPEGSLSARDIIMTIPMDYDEERIQQVNAAITKALYKQAEEFVKNLPPPKKSGFTTLPKEISYVNKKAEEDAAKLKVSTAVVDALQQFLPVNKE